jgi:hypothetical protein
MEAEQLRGETDQMAETCDAWGHVIEKPRKLSRGDRPIITYECELWGQPNPTWLWTPENLKSPANIKCRQQSFLIGKIANRELVLTCL